MLKIGIDIGGTTIKGALFDGAKILEEHSAPTCGGEGREAIVRQLFEVADLYRRRKRLSSAFLRRETSTPPRVAASMRRTT